jgi:hypothetical protein
MVTGATRDYDVGRKNHWRRTIWNEILRRTAGQEKQNVVLYLAGPQDLDRTVALQKGVPDQNLVAIDVVWKTSCACAKRPSPR